MVVCGWQDVVGIASGCLAVNWLGEFPIRRSGLDGSRHSKRDNSRAELARLVVGLDHVYDGGGMRWCCNHRRICVVEMEWLGCPF